MKNKVVILYSGGADSRLLLEFAKDLGNEIYCVLIDYEQLHSKELDVAKQTLDNLKISYQVVSIKGLDLKSALTTGEKGLYENISIYSVPNRNAIFLSLACAVAESKGYEEVWHGADFSDLQHLFPDCYGQFFVKYEELMKLSTYPKVKVRSPLLRFTKEVVLDILKNKRISDIYSDRKSVV